MEFSPEDRAALDRLLAVASRDTGQSTRVADFLLAWWNVSECGGFDFTHLWNLDQALLNDILTLISVIARTRQYPDDHGYGPQFEHLARQWRPTLLTRAE